jgi:4-hydroxy-2-oxoheptanedioate aldolase
MKKAYQDPLLENLKKGKTSIGLWITSPDMVELCGHMGFDCFLSDQMYTGLDWGQTENMIRAGKAAGITPIVRVQSNPWLGGYDSRIAADVLRARGIGANFIMCSFENNKELEEAIAIQNDWHGRYFYIHPFKNLDEWGPVTEERAKETFIIPQIESKKGMEELEETLSIPGLKAYMIAMSDASREVTGSIAPDFYSPKIWEYLHKAVEIGKKKGIAIVANTSYAYSMEEHGKRARMLYDAGVDVIYLQGALLLFQIAIGAFLDDLKKDLGL